MIHFIQKLAFSFSMTVCTLMATAQTTTPTSAPLTKQAAGTFVVNTTTLAEDVKGYRGTTPLEIYIKSGKIVKVEALKNQETPKYFIHIRKELLPKYEGLKVNKVKSTQIDAVTGATFSSKAVIENVNRGLDYYQKNYKKK
jgi:uncharacterized protein with FMN-binding domain